MQASRRLSVIGLGYVGLPVATAFGRRGHEVVAFDIDPQRIAELKQGHDRTGEVDAGTLALAGLRLTSDPRALGEADFHIITVPTPITEALRPDLRALLAATRAVGAQLRRGGIVVYESTVFPGATEEVCVPVLEAESGLTFGRDFAVAYSPERINPGDRTHRFESIVKVVAGSDAETLETVAAVYGSVVTAGIHRAPSIAVAEAAKVIENTQRDLNIALMNELAIICHRLGIDTQDVLAAAGTKWNFLKFVPGLVGGHCIGVDPYYLTHRAEQIGYHPQVILAGRRTNDAMGQYIARETVKHILRRTADRSGLRVTVLGLTFKENVPDVRNTKVIDIVREIESFGIPVSVHDPVADASEIEREYGLCLTPLDRLPPADAVVLAVAHDVYRGAGWPRVAALLKGGRGLVTDVKGCLERGAVPPGVQLWRL